MTFLFQHTDKLYFRNLLLCYLYLAGPSAAFANNTERYLPTADLFCVITIDSIIPVNCHGGTDGKLCFRVNAGSPAYTIDVLIGTSAYNFENIESDSMICIAGLAGGTYQIEITGTEGCMSTGTIPAPEAALEFTNVMIDSVTCNGSADGNIDLEVIGGTAPYNYIWDNDSTSLPLINLNIGTYILSIEDANGCSSQYEPITIYEPDEVTAEIQSTDLSCNEIANGTAQVLNIQGGNGDYSYLWNNNETEPDIDSLSAGNYMITVTDGNGCSTILSTELTEPSELVVTESLEYVRCFGESNGSIFLDAEGGTGSLTYSWSNGGDSMVIENLSAGDYNYSIADENDCVYNNTITIIQPDLLEVHATVLNHVSCNEEADGRAVIMPSGGTGIPYATWDNGTEADTLTDVETGSYVVTITDDNECTAIDFVLIEKELNPIVESYDEESIIRDGEAVNLSFESDQSSVLFHWAVVGFSNVAITADDYEEEGIVENEINAIFRLESNRAPGWILLEIYPKRNDCVGESVQTRLEIYPVENLLFIPELFTPNGDGANDNWEILFPPESTADNYSIKIFNRSGGMIYEQNGIAEQWNASGCPDGVYYYVINNFSSEEVYKGAVTIMRK